MIGDRELEILCVMTDLIKTVSEAEKQHLVSQEVAESHITMYLNEIDQILGKPQKAA